MVPCEKHVPSFLWKNSKYALLLLKCLQRVHTSSSWSLIIKWSMIMIKGSNNSSSTSDSSSSNFRLHRVSSETSKGWGTRPPMKTGCWHWLLSAYTVNAQRRERFPKFFVKKYSLIFYCKIFSLFLSYCCLTAM